MATSLLVGGKVDRESAIRRRKDEYKQDLQLQMRERDAAKQRERMQDMSVNASGYLDPEKSPERFKPLGGLHWTEQREKRQNPEVRPYHTLFLYDRLATTAKPRAPATPPAPQARLLRMSMRRPPRTAIPGEPVIERSPRISTSVTTEDGVPPLNLDMPRHRIPGNIAGIHYNAVTYAGAGVAANNPVDHAYSLMGAHDISYGRGEGGGNSIVQPISMPASNNRPIIVTGQGGGGSGGECYGHRFNPFLYRDDGGSRDYRSLLILNQAERDRMRRDNADFQRRLIQDMEADRRRILDQDAEARRRMEEVRRRADERRREAEKERKEAERLRRQAEMRPQTDHTQRPTSKKAVLYYDMDDYRLRLIEERKKIEELLKAGKPAKEVWDLRVIPKLPATPKTADRANKDNVEDFNGLKFREVVARDQFRSVYPDLPFTNKRLEQQQEALLRQQEAHLLDHCPDGCGQPREQPDLPPRRAISRPSWLDRDPTPFPHVQRKRDQLYSSKSDGDMERIHRRIKAREKFLRDSSSDNDDRVVDGLTSRRHRPSSTDTLTDDTWLRPSSKAEV